MPNPGITDDDALQYMDAPANGFSAVTPSDASDLTNGPCRALYVGGAGNVYLDSVQGDTNVAFIGVAAGSILPVRARRVRSTNTTATSIVALY